MGKNLKENLVGGAGTTASQMRGAMSIKIQKEVEIKILERDMTGSHIEQIFHFGFHETDVLIKRDKGIIGFLLRQKRRSLKNAMCSRETKKA